MLKKCSGIKGKLPAHVTECKCLKFYKIDHNGGSRARGLGDMAILAMDGDKLEVVRAYAIREGGRRDNAAIAS